MKKFLIVLLALNAVPALALENMNANQVVATVTNIDMKIQTVSLTQDGMLSIILRDGGRELTEQLSEVTTSHLVYQAHMLASSVITVEHHVVVCMMIVSPMNMPFLSVARADGEFKKVLTSNNCATPTSIFPEARRDFAEATAVREALIVLATEAVARSN